MADEHEGPEWAQWRASLLDAWIQTRMELDRSLLALSVGGVGLLVTLLTTVGVPWLWLVVPYAIAIGAFLVAIQMALVIFEGNAAYLSRAANDPEAGPDPKLGRCDRHLRWSFWIGVFGTIIVGSASGAADFIQNQEVEVAREESKKLSSDSIDKGIRPTTEQRPIQGPREQSSLDGITNFRPTLGPKPSTPPSGSGGGNNSGSGGGNGSGSGDSTPRSGK